MKMKTTLVFSTSNAFISRAIAWFTRSKASHVMIGIELYGKPFLLHCTAGGVQVTPREKWFRENRLVSEWRFKRDMTDGLRHAMSHLGTQYDYVTLFGWGAVILLWRWFKIRAKNPLASSKAMVCSEFVVHLGEPEDGNNSIPEWQGLDPETTHCQDLLDLLPGVSFEQVQFDSASNEAS
jgi:hypothetical protein